MSYIPKFTREDTGKEHQHFCFQEPENFQGPPAKRLTLETNALIENCERFHSRGLIRKLHNIERTKKIPKAVFCIAVVIARNIVQRKNKPRRKEQKPPGFENSMELRNGESRRVQMLQYFRAENNVKRCIGDGRKMMCISHNIDIDSWSCLDIQCDAIGKIATILIVATPY